MCGIAGYLGAPAPELLPRMLEVLAHRGPDDDGMHVEDGVGLGMTRLAIIDLETGRQPMATADGACVVVFNGEIYNFRKLRAELEAAGHRFRTRSDTEVILEAYRAFGERCVERLRGMFAFALWDGRQRRLLLARDRVGKKPLYYWRGDGLLLFASEIKALLRHRPIPRALDWQALHHYLAFGYTPAARSIFAGIAKLPPAHLAWAGDGPLAPRRYWALPDAAAAAGAVPPAEAPGRVRAALREAVRLRLESDVRLGVFLSGGLDSSAIVASMREATQGPIATFSVGFARPPSYDERRWARLVAERFGTDHHEEVVDPPVADLLPAIVRHFDEPFADSSAVPTFAVAQATARHVKVALSGLGGDEAFAGYPRHLGLRLSQAYVRLPRPVRAVPEALAGLVPESESSRDWGGWLHRFVAGADQPPAERYVGWTRYFGEGDLARLVTAPVRRAWGEPVDRAQRAAFAGYAHGDVVDGALRTDLLTYLPDDLLVMADRVAMASSLEVRAPFCDHRLLEEAAGIAPAAKLSGFRLKAVLRAAFADVLPREVLARRKQGFMVPLARWLRTDLRPLVDDLLAPDIVGARGLLVPAEVAALRREHATGQRNHADRLWTLMMLELWAREYLDGGALWSAR